MFESLKHWLAVVFVGLLVSWVLFGAFGLVEMGVEHLQKNSPDTWAIRFDPFPHFGEAWVFLAVTFFAMYAVHMQLLDNLRRQKPKESRQAAEPVHGEDPALEMAEKVVQRLSGDTRAQLERQIIRYKTGKLDGTALSIATTNAILYGQDR